jgi:cytochrome c553
LPADYLTEQLADFANGTRQQPAMAAIAKALPIDARVSVATYFASLPAPTTAVQHPSTNPIGEELALHGNWNEDVPACVACHGDQGSGVGNRFPPLAGQPVTYLRAQLDAWKNGKRPPGPLGLMSDVARRLGDQEVDAVSTYFASLPPLATRVSQDAQGAVR